MDETVQVLRGAATEFPALAATARGKQGDDLRAAAAAAQGVVASYDRGGVLPEGATANALRAVESSGGDAPLAVRARAVLGPADNFGGRMSFRWIAPFAAVVAVVFAALFVSDRRRAGASVKRQPAPAIA